MFPQPAPAPTTHEADSADGAKSLTDPICVTDGLLGISTPRASDIRQLRGGQDPEHPEWSPGSDSSARPEGFITVNDRITGWVDYNSQHLSSSASDVHVRYWLHPEYRREDLAVRAVQLLMHHLATRTSYRSAALRVSQADQASLAVATATGFTCQSAAGGECLFTQPVPPLTYSDGVVAIRRQRADDIDAHLEAIDDEQIRWLWMPGDRQKWDALTPDERRTHNLRHLRACHATFGTGPKWTFSVDTVSVPYIAYIDCDLANDHVPAGEANISYTCHPAYRGQGYVSRAVRLVMQFLRDHTGATTAHIIVDAENAASLRVAHAAGAAESERWRNEHGRVMIRHVMALR